MGMFLLSDSHRDFEFAFVASAQPSDVQRVLLLSRPKTTLFGSSY